MTLFAPLVFLLLVSLLLIQARVTVSFASALGRDSKADLVPDLPFPKATIILCLRGGDPFLHDCILGLVNQNYPCFQVQIIIDSEQDPAWQVVRETLRDHPSSPVQVSPLIEKRPTCSLKCSALIQALSQLDPDCEVIALIDSDVIPHSTWLQELVRPLVGSNVGAAAGNRWFVPVWNQWGSIFRYIFNANAVAQMYLFNMPFGGSIAFKAEVLRNSELLQKWSQAIGDTPILARTVRELGLEIAFVPMLMGNREGCEIDGFVRWIKRQILMTRLYHTRSRWWTVIGHGILIALIPALALGLLAVSLLTQDWNGAAWGAGGLLTYLLGSALLLTSIEIAVRRVIQLPGQSVEPLTWKNLGQLLIAIARLQIIYPVALLSVIFMQEVEWRGITYQIQDAWNIQLVEYFPFQPLPPVSKVSL
jgi:glycosyltransferase involved in cell wall biosynthesis